MEIAEQRYIEKPISFGEIPLRLRGSG
jgi:hypothetical protein